MLRATRIRLYPNETQQVNLARQFGCARWAWNEALAETLRIYRETGKGLGYHAMTVRLPALKKDHPWLAEANAQVLQQSLRNLSRAFVNFFERRARYPRFKSKHGPQSIQFPQDVALNGSNRIKLPKIGWLKCIVHRPIEGRIKTVTVTRTQAGRYFASILAEDDAALPPVSTDGKAIGIDLGLTDFAVTSDGSKFANPRHLAKAERNLKRKQRKLSRKQKGSNSRNKARVIVARAHERVSNARRDWLHKLSRRLVNENQVIAVEDLCIKAMVRSPTLSKSISDAGWRMFTRMLEYKASWSGKAFIRIGRFFPSSKACSSCGTISDKMPLNVRRWTCPNCETAHDRDVNAAINIRGEALRLMAAGTVASAGGASVSRRRGRKPSTAHGAVKPEAAA